MKVRLGLGKRFAKSVHPHTTHTYTYYGKDTFVEDDYRPP